MPVIARDAVASDHLVYAWPFPIGPEEYEVSCADDELVVMCPSWVVGDRLGPGRHRWRTPDPMRPVSAYFVLTGPVEVSFDLSTQFMIPANGQAVRVRASGSLQVRCLDPALLVAQFVGLPFDHVNDGVLRSVSRSIERMLARLLTRRVVMAGTPQAVTEPAMLPNILEELVAYNPAAGAVFGIELVRFGHMSIVADDGSRPWHHMNNGDAGTSAPELDTLRGKRPDGLPIGGAPGPAPTPQLRASRPPTPPPIPSTPNPVVTEVSGEIVAKPRPSTPPAEASGEIVPKHRPEKKTALGHAAVRAPTDPGALSARHSSPGIPMPSASGSPPALDPHRLITSPAPVRPSQVEMARFPDEPTHPGIDANQTQPDTIPAPSVHTPPPVPVPVASAVGTPRQPVSMHESPHGSILGIGMSHIGSTSHASSTEITSGEISSKIGPGGRVLVPGPNGLMQSATVRQLLQGYYELEVGGSGETIWVPVNGVVPE